MFKTINFNIFKITSACGFGGHAFSKYVCFIQMQLSVSMQGYLMFFSHLSAPSQQSLGDAVVTLTLSE